MADLQTILEQSNDIEKKWTTFVAFPYANAYATALAKFRETKGAQEKLNANKAEYGMLALSICTGGVLTHVFAQTSWKAVVGSQALNVICEKNWVKAFNIANFASTNKAADFVLGGLWETGSKALDAKTKSLFEQNTASFPSTQVWLTEIKVLTSLMGFVNECYLKYRDAARNIFGNTGLSAAERDKAINQLTNSKFAKAPSKSPISESTVAMEIELLLYLRMVMDLDYTKSFSGGAAGGVGGYYSEGKHTPINVMPGAENYPKPYTNKTVTPQGVGAVEGQEIGYEELGRVFYDRINTLYKDLGYGTSLLDSAKWGEYWNATMTEKSFSAAHQAMLQLEVQGMHRFIQTIQ